MCYVLWHSLITLPGDSWKERRGETWNMQKQQVLGERCFGKLFIGFLETFITQVLSFKGSELETCAFCNVTTGEEAICRFCSRSWATTVPNEMCDFMDLFWYSCHKNWESYQSVQHWVNFVLSFCWTFKVGTIEPGCHRWMLWTVFWSPAAQSTWITIHRGKKRKIIDSKGPFPERAKRLVPRKGTSWTWNEIIDLPSLFHQDLDSLQWVQDKMGGAFYRQQWEVCKVKMTPFSCGPKKDVSLK